MRSEGSKELAMGSDQSGETIYLDYTNAVAAAPIQDSMTYNAASQFGSEALYFTDNEITNVYCNGDCNMPGSSKQLNSLNYLPGGLELNK